MKIFTNILTLVLSLLWSIGLVAQPPEYNEKVRALKIAHITEALDLSPEEAQLFWPVYNQHDKRIHQLRKQERMLFRSSKNELKNMSEQEADAAYDQLFQIQKNKFTVQKTYKEDLEKILSKKKILILMPEEKFRRKLLKQFRAPAPPPPPR